MLPATFFSHGSDVIQDKDTPGKHRGKCKPTSSIPSLDPDVFMPILDATNLTELRNAACDTLKHCLPNVERAHVFLTNPENQQVEADGIILPKRGFAWDAFRQKSRQLCSVPFDPDPFIDLLALHSTDVQKVLLAPVPARRKDSNIGIIVASVTSVDLTASEDKYMELLLKQISVSYESMKLFMSEPATENSQLESLIALCADLHDQDAAQLELKVIKYLREHTCSESGFLLLVVPETLELISQVVGSTILPEEVRFPGLWSCFAQALETKQPMFLEHIPQDRRAEVEKIVEKPVHSFLCVPVACKDSHELIALACLVNKSNGQRFGDDDIQIVRQCFKYTATVLTSTLAFQNERKLKNQTQALLHVARKLFTRLGEFIYDDIQTADSLTSISNITRCLHSFQFMLKPFEKDKKLLHSLFSNKESHGTNNSSVKQLDRTGGEYLGENWNVDPDKFFKSSASSHAATVSEKNISCSSENIGLVKKSSVEVLGSISFAESIHKELQAQSTGTDEHLKVHKGDTSDFLPETKSSYHMTKLGRTWSAKEISSMESSSTSLGMEVLDHQYHKSNFARRYSQTRARRDSIHAAGRKPVDVRALRQCALELTQHKNVTVESVLYMFDPHITDILHTMQDAIPTQEEIREEYKESTAEKLSLLSGNSIFNQEDQEGNTTMSQRVIEETPMGKEEGEKEILLSEAKKDIIQQSSSLVSQASTDEAEVCSKTVPAICLASVCERLQAEEKTASQTDVLPHEIKKCDSFIQEHRQFSVLDSMGSGGSLTLQDLIDLQPPSAEYSDERFLCMFTVGV